MKSKKEKNEYVGFRESPGIMAAVRDVAKEEGFTVSLVIRRAIRKFLLLRQTENKQ